MKKKLLSALAFSLALSMNAQSVPGHLGATSAYDDFQDGDQYTAGNNDYSHPVIVGADTTGYRGLFWTEADGTAASGFKATKTRTGTAIDYVITQTEGAYEPFLVVLGEIATVKNVIDLSADANVSFTVTNKGTKTIRFGVQMQDINGTSLVYMPGVIGDEANFYNYNIGYVQGQTTALAPAAAENFAFDFKTAVVGCTNNVVGGQGACTATFDYTKVTGITFTVVDNDHTGAVAGTGPVTCGGYCPLAITDYPIEISNFKMGDQSTLPTSVSKFDDQISYSVFPNPTSDVANVTLQLNKVSSVNITVVDLFGRTVKEVVNGKFSSVNQQINVSDLSQGVYTVNYVVDGAAAKSTLLMVK